MTKKVLYVLVVLFAANSAFAQKPKPWTEWSEKEAAKILNESAWGQTESETTETQPTSSSAITSTLAARAEERNLDRAKSVESGDARAKTTALTVRYRVRWLSAKPIRQAFVRMVEIQSQGANPERMTQLRAFVDRDFGDYIVLTVSLDGSDQKRLALAMREIASADEAVLQKVIYLERKDGKRIFLTNYRPPIQDGLGAKLVFPRTVDGKPFIDNDSGEVRFFADLGETVKLQRRFKVAEMMYDGKLEY